MESFGEKLFILSRNLMIFVGSWQLTDDMSSRNRLSYEMYSYFAFFILSGTITSGTIHFFVEMLSYKNYDKGIELFGLNTTLIVMYIKLRTYRSTTVTSLIKHFIRMTNESGNLNSIAADIVEKKIRYCNFINITVLVLNLAITVYYAINGILDFKNAENEQDGADSLNHLLYIYYPFQNYIGMVSYIEKIVGIYLGFYNAACLTLLNTIIVGLVIQIQVLQYELSDYDKLYQRGNEITDSDDLPTILGLNKLIEKHQNLLSYSSVLNEALKIPILIEYSVSSISIATILVQILKLIERIITDITLSVSFFVYVWFFRLKYGLYEANIFIKSFQSSDASFYIFMVLLVAVELLFFCLNAHDIVVESLRLGEAVYFSNWYERDVPTQKSIRIIMMRSRIPMHVSIGPFGILNAESLISIFKVAYSYVSLLSGEK